MKNTPTIALAVSAAMISTSSSALLISGIIDGGLSGGLPKAIELFATSDIADLSVFTVDNANNGGAFDGTVITLNGSAAAGDFFYVASEDTGFTSYFGFAPDFTGSSLNINGNDVVGLFENAALVDVYGVLGEDGVGEAWEHTDSHAYRIDGAGPNPVFDVSEWSIAPLDTTDGTSTAAEAGFPTGTYAVPEPSSLLLLAIGSLALVRRRR